MSGNAAFGRAKAMLFSPKAEWPIIAERSETVAHLYKDYLLFLAAIPAVASFVKGTIIGATTLSGVTIHVGILAGLGGMVLRYVLWLGVIYALGLVVSALAPNFGGQGNQARA